MLPSPILFDIDQTLLDSDVMDDLVRQNFARILNVPYQTIYDLDEQYMAGLPNARSFNFELYCRFFSDKFSANEKQLLDVFYDPSIYLPCLPPDTIPTLERLQKNYHLGIYSEGHIKFQKIKLDKTNLTGYFQPGITCIFTDKLLPENIAQLPDECIIVDDSVRVLNKLAKVSTKKFTLYQPTDFSDSSQSEGFTRINRISDLLEIL